MDLGSGGEPAEDTAPERDRRAREAALEAASRVSYEPTAQVPFRSSGRLLIIAEAEAGAEFAGGLEGSGLALSLLTPTGPPAASEDSTVRCLTANGRAIRVEGHFGEFSVIVEGEGGDVDVAKTIERDNDHFDMVVDFGVPPLLPVAVPPLGYYAVGTEPEAQANLLAELPEMVGEFEKARYFSYDPDICAHGNSSLQACRRCLDACPAGAITSLVEKVEVDPYLCQGGGICATACPTGAIVYAFPKPRDLLNRLRVLLRSFREEGGRRPALIFHAGDGMPIEQGAFPGNLIPIELEEVGSIGIEVWLACLAYGAERVVLWERAKLPESVVRELDAQLQVAATILSGLGYPESALSRATEDAPEELAAGITAAAGMPPIEPATFAGTNQKRDTLFFAVDHLVAQSGADPEAIPLPAVAPLGEILVDRDACTLCMACVSVCPARALSDGVDEPLLGFVERNCVQCGLCETACPEAAVRRNPRLLLDREQGRSVRVLNREAPFCCVDCGKPFATLSVIAKMKQKLTGHPMFSSEQSLRRLELCEDCRVKDMFEKDDSLLR